MITPRTMYRWELCLAALALAGCQKLTTISLVPAASTMTSVNATLPLSAMQLDADGKVMSKTTTLIWLSEDPSVATVENDGVVTAHHSGRATISATQGTLKGVATVEVHIPQSLVAKDVTIDGPGKTTVLAFDLRDDTGQSMVPAPPGLTYVSADTQIALVSQQGDTWLLTAVSPGTTEILGIAGKVSQKIRVTVKTPEITEVRVEPTSLELKVGTTETLAAKASAGSLTLPRAPLSWTSSDTRVATVDTDGSVTAVSEGHATITVSAGSQSASTLLLATN